MTELCPETFDLGVYDSDTGKSVVGPILDAREEKAEPAGDVPVDITFWYTNYRGERAERHVRPVRVWFGTTEWHPDPPQWFLHAIDREKGAPRDFALKDIEHYAVTARIAELGRERDAAAEKAADQGRKACDLFDEAARAQKAERKAEAALADLRVRVEKAASRIHEILDFQIPRIIKRGESDVELLAGLHNARLHATELLSPEGEAKGEVQPPRDADPVPGMGVPGIYIASKAKHGPRWQVYRAAGIPIISTWIDESGEGQTGDYHDLWHRCATEAAKAAVTVVYHEDGEILKGALVEVGAALSHGRCIIVVGNPPGTWVRHRDVSQAATIDEAFRLATALAAGITQGAHDV